MVSDRIREALDDYSINSLSFDIAIRFGVEGVAQTRERGSSVQTAQICAVLGAKVQIAPSNDGCADLSRLQIARCDIQAYQATGASSIYGYTVEPVSHIGRRKMTAELDSPWTFDVEEMTQPVA